MMGQTPSNKRGVTLISLNLFPAFLLKHRGRCKDDAFHVMIRQLVVQRESEASSLITAYEQSIVPVMEAHGLNVVDDFAVAMMKKPSKERRQKAIQQQLAYVRRDLKYVDAFIQAGCELDERYQDLLVIH